MLDSTESNTITVTGYVICESLQKVGCCQLIHRIFADGRKGENCCTWNRLQASVVEDSLRPTLDFVCG